MKLQLDTKHLCMVLLLCFSLSGLRAQDHKKQDKQQKEMKQEMRDYMKENIFPTVQQARAKLDTKLTETEKDELDYLRKQFRKLMNDSKQMRKDIREADVINGEQWKQMRQAYMKKHRLMAMATDIAQRHEGEIVEILEELEAPANEWRTEMKAMKQKYSGHYKDDHKGDSRKDRKGHHYHSGHGGRKAGPLHLMDPVHFLLFDPEHLEEMME